MTTLGQKLRELRHQKGYKLNEVAEGADLSISFISLIERDKASISVENLQKLAKFYKVRLFQIFQDIEEEEAFIVRDEQIEERKTKIGDKQSALFFLSPEDNLTFRSILAILPPGAMKQEVYLKKGEAFIQVQDGSLELSLPNQKPILLEKGDSAHITSFKGTHLSNHNADKPVYLLIVTSGTTQHLGNSGESLEITQISKEIS
jgi:XRE family transcriptional regulator, regulator of sulfur utilization